MISVVVLAHGDEPGLADCVAAVLADPDVEVVLVDNEADPDAVAAAVAVAVAVAGDGAGAVVGGVTGAGAADRLLLLRPTRNLGFAGGCNTGVAAAHGDVVVLVNSDVVVAPGAVRVLADLVAGDPTIGAACGSVRLASDPDLVNTVGNPVGYVGIAWAGGLGDPASAHAVRVEVGSVTGAFVAFTRATWDDVGGFDDDYFAYHEDVDLSLRLRLLGRRLVMEPAAVAVHDYVFGRHPRKLYLLERNRWITVLTVWPAPVLAVALPVLIALELALLAAAVAQGWGRQKLASYGWLLTHRARLRSRRRSIQSRSVITPAQFAAHLSGDIAAPVLGSSPLLRVGNAALRGWWRLATAALGVRR